MFGMFKGQKQGPGPFEAGLRAYFEKPGRKTAVGLLRGLQSEFNSLPEDREPTVHQITRPQAKTAMGQDKVKPTAALV